LFSLLQLQAFLAIVIEAIKALLIYSGGEAYEAPDFFSRGDGSVGCLQRP
jgi:hypothetical protein